MTEQEKLQNKYYKGESSLEEEKQLKDLFANQELNSADQDILGYFANQNKIPDGLEDDVFANLESKVKKRKSIRMRLYQLSSAAAIIIVLLSVYLDFRKTQNIKLENDFFVMEQALFQISESLQPDVEEEMLVLWVDDDVEIIIN